MLDSLDPFDFILAERLGMTIEEMHNRMTNNEYHRWRAFYVYRQEMIDFENKRRR